MLGLIITQPDYESNEVLMHLWNRESFTATRDATKLECDENVYTRSLAAAMDHKVRSISKRRKLIDQSLLRRDGSVTEIFDRRVNMDLAGFKRCSMHGSYVWIES